MPHKLLSSEKTAPETFFLYNLSIEVSAKLFEMQPKIAPQWLIFHKFLISRNVPA